MGEDAARRSERLADSGRTVARAVVFCSVKSDAEPDNIAIPSPRTVPGFVRCFLYARISGQLRGESLNAKTDWRMARSDAYCSPSTCQPVDTHTAVDKRRSTYGGYRALVNHHAVILRAGQMDYSRSRRRGLGFEERQLPAPELLPLREPDFYSERMELSPAAIGRQLSDS